MAYNENIPQPTDKLKNSQPEILANFQAISDLINTNHVDFDDPDGNDGKHKFLQMPEVAVNTSTDQNEAALFSKEGANSGVTELNFRRESDGDVIPFTEGLLQAARGFSMFGSGLLFKWDFKDIPNVPVPGLDYDFIWTTAGNIKAFTQVPFIINSFVSYSSAVTNNIQLEVPIIDRDNSDALKIRVRFRAASLGGTNGFRFHINAFGI